MKVGNKYRAVAYWLPSEETGTRTRPTLEGTCIYVHPKGKFCTLLFDGGVRASYTRNQITKV